MKVFLTLRPGSLDYELSVDCTSNSLNTDPLVGYQSPSHEMLVELTNKQ